jgi:integrase
MPRLKLSEVDVTTLTLAEGKSETFYWDLDMPGFGCRVRLLKGSTADVKRGWEAQGRIHGKQRRENLGDVRKVRDKDARKAAQKWFAQIQMGIDPRAERDRARAQANRLTLGSVVKHHIEANHDRWSAGTLRACNLHLLRYAEPLHDRPIDTVKRADIAALLHNITHEHGRSSAGRTRTFLSIMFSWAMREGMIESNPVTGTNNPAEGIPPRDRVLSDEELHIVLKSCPGETYPAIVWLLVLTGCRRVEITDLKWTELDLENGLLILPRERVKNRRAFTLPLPHKAIEILKAIPRGEDNGNLVFFERKLRKGRWGREGFTGLAHWKIKHDKQIVIHSGKELPHWTYHDLRRTVRTGLGKLGVRPDIAERCLNHVQGGIDARVYDKYRYLSEMKTALAMWADHVEAVFNGTTSNVITWRKA